MPNMEIHVAKETKPACSHFGASAKNQIMAIETGKTKDKIAEALQSSRTILFFQPCFNC